MMAIVACFRLNIGLPHDIWNIIITSIESAGTFIESAGTFPKERE